MPKLSTPSPHHRAKTALTPERYAALKRDVEVLATTAERTSNHAKVEAFFRLGRRIVRERLKLKSGYHNAVLRDLSLDTPVSLRNLQYAVAFVAAYSRLPARGLSWSHYRLLLDRPDAESRAHYESLARNEHLTSPELASRIRSDVRNVPGGGVLPRPSAADYLYRAKVDNIVDGDTLDLSIDLGFHVDRRGRFRLANIDSPELNSTTDSRIAQDPGRAARDFVFNRLTAAKTIVVHTERTDLHGRYVTHLFYSDQDLPKSTCFEQGTYLNEELIIEGHALAAMG